LKDTRTAVNTALVWLDTHKVAYSTGTVAPVAACTAGAEAYIDTAALKVYWCTGGTPNPWLDLSAGSASVSWGSIGGTLASQPDLAAALNGKAALAHGHAQGDVTGLVAALASKESTANKAQPSGYASLGADGKVPSAQLPAGTTPAWGAITGNIGDQSDLGAALAGKEPASANIQQHIASTLNPHSTTKAQVGLGSVTNDAQLKIASNLSDMNSVSAARANLGLGTAALANTGTGAGQIPVTGNYERPLTFSSPFNRTVDTLTITACAEGQVYKSVSGSWTCSDDLVGAPGSGEANTASNTGTVGVGVFKSKSSVDLQFYKLYSANDRLTIALNGTDRIDATLNEGNIVHQNLSGAGANTHAQLDSHLSSTSNPHSVTAAQAGAPALTLFTALGDTVYRDASSWQRLAGNTAASKRLLCQTGTGTVSAAPSWCSLVIGDIPTGTTSSTVALGNHLHASVYEPVDTTILRQASLAGSGTALTPAKSDHNHAGTYQAPITTGTTAQYLRGDLSLATFPSIPTITGSAVLKGSAGNAVAAVAADVVGLFTGCSGTQYLGADGACHAAAGGVPYTGASTDVDLGTHKLTAAGFESPAGTAFLAEGAEGAKPAAPASGSGNIWLDSTAHLPQYQGSAGTVTGTMVAPHDCGTDFVKTVGTNGTVTCATASGAGHTQNTDTGTTSPTFQIDSGNAGPKIKSDTGNMRVRNAADTADATLSADGFYSAGASMTSGTVYGAYFRPGTTDTATCTAGAVTLSVNYSHHTIALNNQASCTVSWSDVTLSGAMHWVQFCNGATTPTTTLTWNTTVGGLGPPSGVNTCSAQGLIYNTGDSKFHALLAGVPAPSASTLGGVRSIDCTGTGHIYKIGTDGIPVCSADSGGAATPPTTNMRLPWGWDSYSPGNIKPSGGYANYGETFGFFSPGETLTKINMWLDVGDAAAGMIISIYPAGSFTAPICKTVVAYGGHSTATLNLTTSASGKSFTFASGSGVSGGVCTLPGGAYVMLMSSNSTTLAFKAYGDTVASKVMSINVATYAGVSFNMGVSSGAGSSLTMADNQSATTWQSQITTAPVIAFER
jgi:hypothetical protein